MSVLKRGVIAQAFELRSGALSHFVVIGGLSQFRVVSSADAKAIARCFGVCHVALRADARRGSGGVKPPGVTVTAAGTGATTSTAGAVALPGEGADGDSDVCRSVPSTAARPPTRTRTRRSNVNGRLLNRVAFPRCQWRHHQSAQIYVPT